VKAERFSRRKMMVSSVSGAISTPRSNVFLNPPYHRELARLRQQADRRVDGRPESSNDHADQQQHDTEWFRKAAKRRCDCFTNGRIAFTTPSGGEVAPTQGRRFSLRPERSNSFVEVFVKIASA